MNQKTPLQMLELAALNDCLVSSESLKSLVVGKDINVLDIRFEDDRTEKIINGSINCHWHDVHKLVKSKELPNNLPIVVICYTGQSSMHVAVLLNLLGYEAYSLLDGMEKY